MKRKKLKSAQEICKDAKRITVLENVSNPTNVGAIMRNAAALYMDAVLFTKGSSDPLYRRAIRVSMGTVFQIRGHFFRREKSLRKLPEWDLRPLRWHLPIIRLISMTRDC